VREISAGADTTELRVERGLANINVHHAAQGAQILVDLPGGQLSLLKDGLYTFNAASNTARVLKGEAKAFPSTNASAKAVKVKEDHAVTFGALQLHSVEFYPAAARADLLPAYGYGEGEGHGPYYSYGPYYGPYGDGFYGYGYPYYAYGWGYPYYGWGYPYYGWGYPGFGIGFGYYGGFGGFRGGFRR
jgi:hypothetical protein